MPSTRSSNRAGGGLNLAALANPAPASTELPDDDFDPTGGALPRDANADSGDDDSGDGFSDDDVGAVDDGVLAPTEDDKDDKGGRLRMRGGLSLDELGAEYHGKRTSRKAMEEAWAGAEDPDAEEDSEDDDDEEDEDDSMEGLDADDLARMEREAAEDDDGSDEDEEDIDDEDSDEEDEEDDDDDSGADVDVDDDDDESQEASDDDDDDGGDGGDLAAELAAFRREEAEANRLAAAKSQNAVKGAAVRRQNEMWEKALQTRIVLQRGLNASAKMPTPTYWRALAKADGEVKPAMATCAAAARGALDALCSLQAALIDGNPAIAEAAGDVVGVGGKKRKASSAMAAVSKFGLLASPASEVWENVDSVYQRYAAFRDVSIDRWHRKAQVQVGKMSTSGGGGEMRAFNQSVSAQVASAMRIPDRLVRKSQPPAHLAPKRLGEPEGTEKAAPTGDRTEDLDADDLEAAARAEARVEEIYDDADFYEQVLKEFLESAGAAAGLAAAASKPAKRRKVVDRRASKGRKLRYHVQQKLVNFCAPVELEVPQWAEKIFGQLFASSA